MPVDFLVIKPVVRAYQIEPEAAAQERITMIFRDFTEARRLEALKSEFLGVLSGKLETALDRLRAAEGEIRDKNPEYAVTYEHVHSLATKLYYFYMCEAGPLRLVRREENLHDFVRECVDVVSLRLRAKGIRLTERIEAEPDAGIEMDRRRMVTMLTTMLDNAITFSPSGADVDLVVLMNDELEISVTDHGSGLSKEMLAHLYDLETHVESFFRSKEEDYSRHGIGLIYVKRIVEAHGGTFEVESEPNVRTWACARIPRDRRRAQTAPPEQRRRLRVLDNGARIRFPADTAYVVPAREAFSTRIAPQLREDVASKVELALDELVVNAVEHGAVQRADSRVEVCFQRDGTALLISVEDAGGTTFNPLFFERYAMKKGLSPGGRGILLLSRIMDELVFLICPNKRTIVVATKEKAFRRG